ncbi:MAG: DUF5360 family protein [Gammaproteobacteria bacterium AqS3]|nr:DUF5360 family protein [Gammaproteobacteria bacterium AqS3]
MVDIGLLLYWGLFGLDWLPAFAVLLPEAPPAAQYSFCTIDLLVAISGLYSLYEWRSNHDTWRMLAVASLALMLASGLQLLVWTLAIAASNVLLIVVSVVFIITPLVFMNRLVRNVRRRATKIY